MENDHEFKVVNTSRGKKHVQIDSPVSNPSNVRKNETNRLFTTKVSVTFNMGNNTKFNLARPTKLFEAIKQVDKNAVLVPVNDPKYRMYLSGDMPRDPTAFKSALEPEQKNRGKQLQIIMYLESNFKLSDIKKDPTLQAFLNQEPKTFIRAHEWTSTNIVSVGMFTNKHYSATFRRDFQKKVQDFMEYHINNDEASDEDDDDEKSESTKQAKNSPEHIDAPRVEISPILRSHWEKDDKGNRTGKATHSMVLNVRCEAHHANLVIDTLYNNSHKMEMHEFGLFMSYEHSRAKNDFYGEVLKRNNIFHNSIETFSIYGLHEEVLHGENYDFRHEAKYYAFPYLNGLVITERNKTTEETRDTTMIHSIERTNKTDELGRWLVVANKRFKTEAEDAIREIVDDWILTEAYEKHKDTNDSFKKGIRFTLNDKPIAAYDSYCMHEHNVKESLDYYDNETDSLNTPSTNTASNKRKKVNPITFEFSNESFPELKNHGINNALKPNAWNQSPTITNRSQEPTASISTDSNASSPTTETNQSTSNNEFQAKFNAQILEMKNFVQTKSDEAKKDQQTLQENILAQNEQLLEYKNLLKEQDERHQLQMLALNNKIDMLSNQFSSLLSYLGANSANNEESDEKSVAQMEITPKNKKHERSFMDFFSLGGGPKANTDLFISPALTSTTIHDKSTPLHTSINTYEPHTSSFPQNHQPLGPRHPQTPLTDRQNNIRSRREPHTTPRIQRTLDHFWTNRNTCLEKATDHTLTWGDYPSSTKNHTRILFQNINGIRRANKYSKAHIIGMSLDSLKVDIAGLAETNLDWNNYENKNSCTDIFRNYWRQSKIGMTSSSHQPNQFYQPGGVAMITGYPWSSRSKISCDPSGLGRWTESEISGRNNRKIVVISAYMVCKDSIERSGPNTAFTQQWRILKEKNPLDNPDPRKIAFDDLKERIHEIKRHGNEVIIMLDANDTLQNTRSALTKWTSEVNLIDPLIQRHGTDSEPPTFARGSKRIDYILLSECLSEYVISCGILPLHSICFSDHRAIFIDIDVQAFLRSEPPSNLTRVSRGISSEDPRAVKRYQANLSAALDKYNFESMISEVERMISIHGANDIVHEMLELIDTKFTQVRLNCEKQSQSKYKHPWSPKLKDASLALNYWNVWLSQFKMKKDLRNSRIRYLTNETYEYEMDSEISIEFVKFKLSQAQKRLHEIQGKAEEYRLIFLEDKAKMYSEEGNQGMESIVKRIIHHERKNKIFQKLKWIRGKTLSGGIDYVITKDEEGQEKEIRDPEKIFEALIRQNINHFSQADSTEMTRDPLKSILGPTGTTEECDEILNGNFCLEEIDCSNAAKSIIRQLKRSSESAIDDEITSNNIQQIYRKWGEYTTTSPSGLHLSHDRAALRFMDSQRITAESTQTITLCDRVFGIKAKMLQFAISHEHTYQRWTKVVNALIEKIPGKPLINKLRVIHLIESDFNLLIGLMWGRRLVSHCEKSDLFDEGQGGSRPDRRTQELLLQKHLVYSTWRLAKISGTSFDNDAKSCFDRIVMPLASIASQQVGMPKRMCKLFLNTLSKMKYHVKTSAGISEQSYSTTSEYTIHGPGQGGRGSPCIWLVISSLIMKAMKSEKSRGAQLTDPHQLINITQHMTGFVDDITHWYSTMDYSEPITEIEQNTKYTAQLWSQLLSTTGGKLELQKCFSYFISWMYDAEGISRMATPAERSLNIILQDSETQDQFHIIQKPNYESHKTLGVMECPSGNYKDEFQRLMIKSKGFAQVLATSKLTRYEAQTLYFTTYIPSMIYSAAIGTLTAEQSEQIQGAVTQQFLAKLGFNRCIPSAVSFGPPSLGGVGLRNLFREQGTEKALFIIRLLRTDRPASRILRIQLAWAQQVSGISAPILEDNTVHLPQLQNELWISTLRNFLGESQLKIKILQIPMRSNKCENDFFLMDAACSMQLSDTKICMINRCRIFLKAETISDVASYSGKELDKDALDCNESARIISPLLWPFQPRPGPKHRKTWKQFLKHFCHIGSIKLENPLGEWTCHRPPKREGCTTFYLKNSKQALSYSDNQCKVATITERRSNNLIGTFHNYEQGEDDIIIPSDMKEQGNKRFIEWRDFVNTLPQEVNNNNDSWETYLLNLPNWEQQLIKKVNWIMPMDQVLKILEDENREVTIVSDGGCSSTHGGFGWIIANQLTTMVEGQGTVTGEPMSSHRAEAFGKLSWIIFLHHTTLYFGITVRCSLRSFCDNKAIVEGTNTQNLYSSLYQAVCPNFDVLRSIAIKQQQLTASTTNYENTRHVKAHQDQRKKFHDLSNEEKLNVRADILATQALESAEQSNHRDNILPLGMAYISIGNNVQSSNEQKLLRWRHSEFKLQDYYSDKFKIKTKNLTCINWAALRLAREKLRHGQRTFSIKHAIGWLATGTRMQMQGRILSECPFCGNDEDTDHLFRCPQKEEQMESTANSFRKYLQEIKTKETITTALTEGFRNWSLGNKHNCDITDHAILDAIREQTMIGWNLLVRGFISTKWAQIQEGNTEINENYSGDAWGSKICFWWINKSHEVWTIRNNTLHDSDKNKNSWKDKETREQVKRMYNCANYMDADDRQIFNIPIDTKLSQSTASLQAWITTMEPIIKICMEKQEISIRNQHRDIRSYLQRNTDQTQDEDTPDLSITPTETQVMILTNTPQRDYQHEEPSPHHNLQTELSNTNNQRLPNEPENIYLSQPSGKTDPPDRVETPREGDTDRAASHLRAG